MPQAPTYTSTKSTKSTNSDNEVISTNCVFLTALFECSCDHTSLEYRIGDGSVKTPPRCAFLSVHRDIAARQCVQQTTIARRSVFCAPTLSLFIFIPTSSTFADFFRRHTIEHVVSHNRSFAGDFLQDCPTPTKCGRQTATRGTARRWQLHAPTRLVFHMRPLDCRRAATARSCSALPDFLLVTAPSLSPRHRHTHVHPRKRLFLAFEAPRSCASLSECQPSSGSRTLFHTVWFRRTTNALQIYECLTRVLDCSETTNRATLSNERLQPWQTSVNSTLRHEGGHSPP